MADNERTGQGERGTYDILRLDNQLCFALYAATRAITRTYMERLGPLDLTYPQYLVLLVLWEGDGATISEIGTRLMLDSGTVTPVVKRLEAMGVVRRERGQADERTVLVWLTQKGIDLREKVVDVRRYVACELKMEEEEILALRGELVGLIERLDPEGKES